MTRFNLSRRQALAAGTAAVLAAPHVARAQAARTVKMGSLRLIHSMTPHFYQRFAPPGLNIEVITFDSPTDGKNAVVTRSVDFGGFGKEYAVDIAAQIAFDARKPWLIVAAALAALAPLPVYFAYSDAVNFNTEQVRELRRRHGELNGHLTALRTIRDQANELQAVSAQLEFVVLNQANWPTVLADLQTRVSECKNTWVDEIRMRREALAAAPAPAEGQPAEAVQPATITKIVVTARFLQPEVPPNPKASHNSATFIKRQNELLAALRKSPFVAEIPESEIKADFNLPYQPRVTFTLVIRKEKAL